MIPARSLNELARVLNDTDDPVEVMLAPARNQVLFHLEGIDLVSRLIDGQFPNYQQVLPKGHTTRTVVDREELLQGGQAGRPDRQCGGQHRQAPGRASDGGGVVVTAAAEVGDNEGLVEATVEGDGTTIAFNSRYLSDVLQNVTAEQFALELNGPLSPGVFRPIGDDTYTHVVMPVRTTS